MAFTTADAATGGPMVRPVKWRRARRMVKVYRWLSTTCKSSGRSSGASPFPLRVRNKIVSAGIVGKEGRDTSLGVPQRTCASVVVLRVQTGSACPSLLPTMVNFIQSAEEWETLKGSITPVRSRARAPKAGRFRRMFEGGWFSSADSPYRDRTLRKGNTNCVDGCCDCGLSSGGRAGEMIT